MSINRDVNYRIFLTFSALATYDSAFLLTISINKAMVSFGKVTPHFNFFLYPITNAIRKFAYTNSIYTIVALAFERYLSICHREKAKWLCSTSKAKLLIKIITILSFVYTIPIFCEHTWEKDENGTIRAVKTILRTKGPVRDMYYPVYRTWANFFVLFVIPTISLMILNTLTIKKVTFFMRLIHSFTNAIISQNTIMSDFPVILHIFHTNCSVSGQRKCCLAFFFSFWNSPFKNKYYIGKHFFNILWKVWYQ